MTKAELILALAILPDDGEIVARVYGEDILTSINAVECHDSGDGTIAFAILDLAPIMDPE